MHRLRAATYLRMPSISLEMLSSSMMAEKSVSKPPADGAAVPFTAAEEPLAPSVGVSFRSNRAVCTVAVADADGKVIEEVVGRVQAVVAMVEVGVVQLELSGAREEEEEDVGRRGGACCFRSDGGIILGASSVGAPFPRTFSAMRNMASANCSALSLPTFSKSHKFLQVGKCHINIILHTSLPLDKALLKEHSSS